MRELFSKTEKSIAKENTLDYLLKKNEVLDQRLKYHAAGGDFTKLKEVLKEKKLYERVMLCKYALDFSKEGKKWA